MKLRKLAEFLVSETYEGCPGDELYMIAIDRKIAQLLNPSDDDMTFGESEIVVSLKVETED